MNVGIVMRSKPRLVVKRGYDPNQPKAGTKAARVKSGVTILSGQVCSLAYNSGDDVMEWELGWVTGRTPYIALQDSKDEDVVSANSLVGYSGLGDFVLQTGFLKTGDVFNVDTPVSPDGTTGDLKAGTVGSGTPILGYVTEAAHDLLVGQNGYPAISGVTNTVVVAFQTSFSANPV